MIRTLGEFLLPLALVACAGCAASCPCGPSPSCAAGVLAPVRSSPAAASSAVAPTVPADVVLDDGELDEDWEPILSNHPGPSGAVPPKDWFERARSILDQHRIWSYGECDLGWCWLSVRAVDADAAVRLLSADPALAPFSQRGVEDVEDTDARVLRSKSRPVADRAAVALREHRIEPMVEEHDGIFEVWVDTVKYRDAAMTVLRADASLRPYAARSKYGRDQSLRPTPAPAAK